MSKDGTVGNIENVLEIHSTGVAQGRFFAGFCGGAVEYGSVQFLSSYRVNKEFAKYFV